jgi:AcrR family transcriptional regulator
VTRVTFDRLFGSKDDLIVAYLAARSVRDRARVEAAWLATPDDPSAVLRAIVADVVAQSREPVFRGSPYINAAAEYADADHPVRRVVAEHRAWFRLIMVELLTELGRPNADAAADQMVLLHDGGMVGAYLGDRNTLATALTEAGAAVIDHR